MARYQGETRENENVVPERDVLAQPPPLSRCFFSFFLFSHMLNLLCPPLLWLFTPCFSPILCSLSISRRWFQLSHIFSTPPLWVKLFDIWNEWRSPGCEAPPPQQILCSFVYLMSDCILLTMHDFDKAKPCVDEWAFPPRIDVRLHCLYFMVGAWTLGQ